MTRSMQHNFGTKRYKAKILRFSGHITEFTTAERCIKTMWGQCRALSWYHYIKEDRAHCNILSSI